MSIYKGNKKVVALYKGATPIIRRYKGTQLIFDATPSDEPIITDTLSFAWSGTSTSQTFKINTTTKTATTNPYSATLTELGVDKFTTAYQMFYNKSAITAITSIPDTTDVGNMQQMFYRCTSVTSLDVTKTFNTSNVTNMNNMFAYCYKLKTLDLSNWDISKVTQMNNMFYNSTALTEVNLSGWDLRNVTSKASMFGNGVKPTKVIMNGCDCDTILFIRQEIANNGVDHTKVVQTDTVCPLGERKESVGYNVYADSSCAWNKYVYPDTVNKEITTIDEYGVTSRETFTLASTEYTVKFELKGGTSVEGDNESDEAREIYGNINYNGEIIYTYGFTQKAKPQDVGDTFYLSCDSPKDVAISELIIDMNDVPPADDYYFARFSRTPNGYGDCNDCFQGDISIALHEDMISGEINMQITDLPMNDEGKYVLTFNEPHYFQCSEQNFAFDNMLCVRYAYNNISLRLNYPYEFNLYLNNNQYMINSYELTDNGDNTYTFTKDVNEILGGEQLNNCTNAFSSINTRLVELISFPITSNVDNIGGMFMGCGNITSLDLSYWDTSQIWNMRQLFNNCDALTSLDLSNWTIKDDCDTDSMFNGCGHLREIKLRNSDNATYMKIQDALNRSGINAMIITE